MNINLDILKELGFNEREAKTYVSLLEIGSTTTGPLIEKTKIPASKIYDVLRKLENKGFANHIVIKNHKRFQAADPKILLNYMEKKYEELEKYVARLEELRKQTHEKQYAEFYEGRKAIFSLIRHLIKNAEKGEDYFNFSFDDELKEPALSSFFSSIGKLSHEKGLNIKTLSPANKRNLIETVFDEEYFRITNNKFTKRYVPEGLIIIGNDIILVEWEGKPSAVRIRSKTFADNYRELFNTKYDEA